MADCGRTLRPGVVNAQLVAAMEHSPIGTALVGLDGTWLWTNAAIRTLLDYSREELDRLDFQRVTHADDLAADVQQVGTLIAGERSAYQIEKRYLRKDGSILWCLQTVSLIRNQHGAADCFLWKVQDISQRKADEIERAVLAERLRIATQAGGVGVWEWDVASGRLICDARMFALYGLSADAETDYDLLMNGIDPAHRDRIDALLQEALAGTGTFDTEFPIIAPGGEVRHLRAKATVVHDPNGVPVRMIGTNWDITAERRLFLLEHEKDRFRAAIEAVEGVLWTNDATGRMVGEQPGWAALTGQGPAEYQDYGWAEAVHPDDAQPTLDAWNEAVAERRTFVFEHRVRRHDGAWRLFSIRAVPLLDPDDDSLLEWVGVHTDITEPREAEARLQQANVQLEQVADEFRTLAEGMPELCWMAKPDGHIYWYNQHWYDYTGTVAADMEGWGWQSVHDPAVLPTVIERWSASISTGQAFEMTFPLRGADGVFRPFLTRVAPIFDPDGKVLRWLGININVAVAEAANAELERRVEARTAELKAMTQELHTARHVAEHANRAKTRFLAGMSHELRTPLNGILGYAQLLRLEGELNATQIERVDAMLGAGKHLLGLITSVLDLSEIEAGHLTLQMAEIDLPGLADECLEVVAGIAQEKRLTLDVSIGQGVPDHLVTDATRLRQVLLNLLGNALKFTSHGGVELRLRWLAGRQQLRIEVADTGPGIDPELRARLFLEFERLRTAATARIEGSGLGLAFSARLVALLGGEIGVDNRPGGGGIFWVELPSTMRRSAAQRSTSGTATPVCADQARQLCVLVADDVAINREIAQAFLRNAGHQVTCVTGGVEAVAAATDVDFDVILMDVSMPEMDGLEATRRIRCLSGPRGLTPIIGVTAHAFSDKIAECLDAGMDAHLSKPFTHEDLAEIVLRAGQSEGVTQRLCGARR